ncbi:MAG: iron ABC transporter permease [Anaerolineae bacterium]|nr:iron ABC transporter permease [Candidatus Roseilinea sp.]MDW8449352.1 iron ABC transporter permease [Anaerolineae bacterium]
MERVSAPPRLGRVAIGSWRWPAFDAGSLAAALPAFLVLLPLIGLALAWLRLDGEIWSHLWSTLLPEMLLNTALLMFGVGATTLALGTALAWLVTTYAFPGSRSLEWLLVLPIAIPGYILGYVSMSLFDYAGPFQTQLRAWFGPDLELPEFRSLPGAIFVLSLTLYPYVYLLARAAFREQSAAQRDAARAAGLSGRAIFWRVALPLARPSLAAGVALALMETLTDFAVVRYFNTVTLSEGVVRLWIIQMDRDAAIQLASLLMLIALGVVLAERRLRRRARFYQLGNQSRPIAPVRLRGWRAIAALAGPLLLLLVAFGLPLVQLTQWAIAEVKHAEPGTLDAVFGQYLFNTLALSLGAALLVVAVALAMAYVVRPHGTQVEAKAGTRFLARLATLGYAMPGAVVALGVLLLLAPLNEAVLGWTGGAVLLSASVFGLMYAYLVRFLAIGFSSVEASLEKVTPNMEMAARSLGAGAPRLLAHVHLPLMRTGILAALLLVFVDTLKELPVTMFLRPFGMETLSVWTYMLASESAWQAAAVPALTIVLASVGPALLLIRLSRASAQTDWETRL